MKGFIIALSVSVALVFGSSVVVAQYAQPTGSLTLTSNTVTAPAGANVQLTCTLRDATGQPIANAPCTFTIVSEPGTDAAVGSKVVTRTTNAQGIATTNLAVGSTPGQVVVAATSGTFRSVTVVSVSGSAPSGGSGTAGGPQAPVVIPPSTGDGGLIGK